MGVRQNNSFKQKIFEFENISKQSNYPTAEPKTNLLAYLSDFRKKLNLFIFCRKSGIQGSIIAEVNENFVCKKIVLNLSHSLNKKLYNNKMINRIKYNFVLFVAHLLTF